MAGEEILVKIGIDAIAGPAVASIVSSVFQRSKQRRKCSSYYTVLLHGPPALADEIARLGVEEGCWSESFVSTFRRANNIRAIDHKAPEEVIEDAVEKTVTSPSAIADTLHGDVDEALASAIKQANQELLEQTISR